MVFQEFFYGIQNLTILDLLVILLFPAIFDYSRTLGKILFLELHKTRTKHDFKKSFFKVHDPLVSILIPAHNEESCIEESIKAALNIWYPNKEIIVIDDCSTDKTYSIAKKYASKNLIKLLHRNSGGSKAEALNYGYLFCKGEVIVTTDADTIIEPHSIEYVVREFDDREVMAVSGNVSITSGDDGINNILTKLQRYEYQSIFEIGKKFSSLLNTILVVSGAFASFRRDAINWEGKFCKDTLVEDFDKSLKVRKMGKKIAYAKEALAHTHCPNNIGTLKQQRNRWASGLVTTILKHKRVFYCSDYKTRFRLTLCDMMIMDVVLNFVSFAAMIVLVSVNIMSIVMYGDFSSLEYTVHKLCFLFTIYLGLEAVVLFYLNRTTKLVSLKSIYLIPIMVFLYRPMLKIISLKGHLSAFVGIKSSW